MRYISSGRYDWTPAELKAKYSRINDTGPKDACLLTVELKVAGEAGLFDSYRTSSIRELGYILAPAYGEKDTVRNYAGASWSMLSVRPAWRS